jgi:hypothetical protein
VRLDELNPDYDTTPTGRNEMRAVASDFYFHDAQGATCGVLPEHTVRALWRRYHQTLANNTRPKDAIPTTQPFIDETILLLKRYRNNTTTENDTKVDLRNHWATPAPIMRALRETFNIKTEMFASPLNVNPATDQFYSAFHRDTVFGATHDAYAFFHPSATRPCALACTNLARS